MGWESVSIFGNIAELNNVILTMKKCVLSLLAAMVLTGCEKEIMNNATDGDAPTVSDGSTVGTKSAGKPKTTKRTNSKSK